MRAKIHIPLLSLILLTNQGVAQTIDEVTVEGTKYASKVTLGKTSESPRQIPNSVSVITEQRIADQQLTTVADALANVTGVTVIPNSTAQSQYKSRGYALAVMYDGVPTFSSLSGYQQFDLAMYERVEVLRGPAGLLQGSSEPGGVVNLVRKRGHDQLDMSLALTAGRWSNQRAVVDVAAPLNGSKSLRARTVALYQERDEFADLTHGDKSLVYGSLDWDITRSTSASLSAVTQDSNTSASYSGLPAWASGFQLPVPRSTNSVPAWERDRWETREYALELNHRFDSGWALTVRASQRDQDSFFHDALITSGVNDVDYTVQYGRREYDYDYRHRGADFFVAGPVRLLGRTHSLLLGYNVDHFDRSFQGVSLTANNQLLQASFDRIASIEDFSVPYDQGGSDETRQSGFYARARLSIAEPLTVVVGARSSDYSSRSRTAQPAAATDWSQGLAANDQVTPFGGIIYDLTRWLSLYASYSDIFVSQSTSLRVDGVPLEPRVGRQHEAGLKAEFFEHRLSASLAVFNLRDRHRSMRDVANPGFFLNAGEVVTKGWEMEVAGSPVHGYEVQAGYARLGTRFVTAPPNQQGQIFSVLEPRHSWRLWGVRRTASLSFGIGLNGQSEIEYEPLRRQGAHSVLNAMVGYELSPHVALNFNASNLLDQVYYARLGGASSYNTYGEPRNYLLTLRSSF